jgi:DnaJ-class molecular chaperone
MSERNDTIKLTAPTSSTEAAMVEHFYSVNHTCLYCNGRGWFHLGLHENDDDPSRSTVMCPVCGGSGMMDAVVSIEWVPSHQRQ